jgi:hypothetical protein
MKKKNTKEPAPARRSIRNTAKNVTIAPSNPATKKVEAKAVGVFRAVVKFLDPFVIQTDVRTTRLASAPAANTVRRTLPVRCVRATRKKRTAATSLIPLIEQSNTAARKLGWFLLERSSTKFSRRT